MSKYSTLLGLPALSLNVLSFGIAGFIGCAGVRIIYAPNLALKIANAQIITSTTVDKLDVLAAELGQQAEVIEQKDQAYQKLEHTYQNYLANETGGIELDKAFDAMKELPELGDIQEIQTEIAETGEDLLETVEIIDHQ